MNLKVLRMEIDNIDRQILLLLQRRMNFVQNIGKEKRKSNRQITDSGRERQINDNWLAKGKRLGLEPKFVKQLLKLIIKEATRIQKL